MASAYYASPPPYNSLYPSQTHHRPPSTTTETVSRQLAPCEQTPLVGYSKSRRINALGWIGATILVLFFTLSFAQNVGLVRCPLNDVPASEKAELRRQWALERDRHLRELGAWYQERLEHASERRGWDSERRAEEERRQAARDAWEREKKAEEQERQAAREAFEKEAEEWRQRREEEERHRLEVVRRSQGVYWTEPHGEAHCHSYGTRTYSSYLKDVPEDLNWLEVCDNMPPVVIHGREVSKPYKCERSNNNVIGVWYVDFDEPNCKPYWEKLYDNGCTPGKTGYRRFEARLDGIGKGDDWGMMCSTAPATIGGTHFERPTTCENRGTWSGMVGIWDVRDYRCGRVTDEVGAAGGAAA